MDSAELIVVRELVPDEWELYRDIRLESLLSDPAAFTSKYEDAVLLGEEVWPERIANGSMIFAVREGRAVGMVGAIPDENAMRIVSMFVSPSFRGSGVGRRLMETMIARIGDGVAVLDVNPEQVAAYRLYQSLGFVPHGTSPFDGCHLRLILSRPQG